VVERKIKSRSQHLGLLGMGTKPLEENLNKNFITQAKCTNTIRWDFQFRIDILREP
jgi:hypothetical protein